MASQLGMRLHQLSYGPPLMSALGQKQTSRHVRVMSVISLKADINQRGLHVRFHATSGHGLGHAVSKEARARPSRLHHSATCLKNICLIGIKAGSHWTIKDVSIDAGVDL